MKKMQIAVSAVATVALAGGMVAPAFAAGESRPFVGTYDGVNDTTGLGWFYMPYWDGTEQDVKVEYAGAIAEFFGKNTTDTVDVDDLKVKSGTLDISNTLVETTTGAGYPQNIERLQGLTGLVASDNYIADTSFVGCMTGLTTLDLSGNKLTGIDWKVTQTQADRYGCTVNNSIANLTGLTDLSLSNNEFDGTVMTPLATLTSLKNLDLSGNSGINDITPLLGLGLDTLNLAGTGIFTEAGEHTPFSVKGQKEAINKMVCENGVDVTLPDGSAAVCQTIGVNQTGSVEDGTGTERYVEVTNASDNSIGGIAAGNADFDEFLKELDSDAIFLALNDRGGCDVAGCETDVTLSGLEAGKVYFLYHYKNDGSVEFVRVLDAVAADGTLTVSLDEFSGYVLNATFIDLARITGDKSGDATVVVGLPASGFSGEEGAGGASGVNVAMVGAAMVVATGATVVARRYGIC